MSKNKTFAPVWDIANFYAVTRAVVNQTIAESTIVHAINMGSFTVYHGTRSGSPILIVEHVDQQTDQLSGIWYSEVI